MSLIVYPFSAPTPLFCSPFRARISSWHEYRTDVVPSDQRRFEHAESDANMGSAMPIRDFLKNFFPNLPHRNSQERRGVAPWMMDTRIVNKIRVSAKANSERGIAAAWVSGSGCVLPSDCD